MRLELTDDELEDRLKKLVKADVVAQGGSSFDYRGLGDPVFEIVFRKIYEKEIEQVDADVVQADIERRLKRLQGQVVHYKGMAAEQKVRYYLMLAGRRGVSLAELVGRPPDDLAFGPFSAAYKKVFQPDQESRIEVDVFCQSESPACADLVVEVKDWAGPVKRAELDAVIEKKARLEPVLGRPAGFLFYSEQGLAPEHAEWLAQRGIMVSDAKRLARYLDRRIKTAGAV